ncbi:hypothetical protein [Vibrio harveyi]|uniref:hypothetical protein n=1 Tax=Vibrio harveyi TaxID=669 RepID=UPI00247FE241|nr:hypothetical protein [Vibrio harveyi]
MQNRSSYDFIHIGLILRLLQDGDYSYSFAITHLNLLLELIDEVGFEVSFAYTESESFASIYELVHRKSKSSPEESMDKVEIEQIAEVLQVIEKIVFSESSTKKIYTIPSRRYNSKYLLDSPEKLFKDGDFDVLSTLARVDLASAARCIVFGEATAAAFHVLRATEDTLKQYYFVHRKQKRLAKPMWANMVEQLRTKKTNKPPKALLDSLNMVRENYRNPTQHPEALYTIDTAQDLFGVCIDLIGKMAKEL